MGTILAGMTGAQFINALNNSIDNPTYFNVKKYGVVGDGVTNDTAAIQALIESTKVTGGTLYFPPGVYLTNTLTLYGNVMLLGDRGTRSSALYSAAAEPLVQLIHETFYGANAGIQHMVLHGHGLGTIGLLLQWVGVFRFEELTITSFTTYDVHLIGSLVGIWENVIFGTTVGCNIYAEEFPNEGLTICSEQMLFKGCEFYQAQQWSLKWMYGAHLMFENCTWEVNGMPGNQNTGCIYYARAEEITAYYWHGILMKNCWFEANRGICVHIEGYAAQEQIHVIENTTFHNNNAADGLTIKINSSVANRRTIKLFLRNSVIADTNAIEIADEAGTIISEGSVVDGTITGSGFVNTIDINGIMSLPVQASPPSPAVEGQIYADTDHHIYYYNGTDWKQLDN